MDIALEGEDGMDGSLGNFPFFFLGSPWSAEECLTLGFALFWYRRGGI